MGMKVIVIGGGASGLTAAIWAARAGGSVTLLEHMDRVGKKILSTGNGKCNLTNLVQEPSCYRGERPEFACEVIRHFSVEETLDFFKGLGVLPKIKNGYVYPNSEQASAVLDVLRMEAEHQNVKIVCGCEVKQIRTRPFQITASTGEYRADRVILATGGKAAPATGSDGSGYRLAGELGHRIIKPLPALVQLRCGKGYEKQLAGIRTEARVTLTANGQVIAADTGELQLTDYGISGIPVFQVSRYAARALDRSLPVTAIVDCLPALSWEETLTELQRRKEQMGYQNAETFFTGLLNKKLAHVVLKKAGVSPDFPVGMLNGRQLRRLAEQIKGMEFSVTATNPFAQAQICCGGADTAQVNPDTMESRLVPGLYLAGELLDVDGICGGYNLQFAWSSGYLAGISAGGGHTS